VPAAVGAGMAAGPLELSRRGMRAKLAAAVVVLAAVALAELPHNDCGGLLKQSFPKRAPAHDLS